MTQEITINGRKPVNPIGTCFDSAAWAIVGRRDISANPVMCHGIGVTNIPGEEPVPMAHAWIEFTNRAGRRLALDTTWMIGQRAKKYRRSLQISLVIEYPFKQFCALWIKHNFPGPYDDRIRALTLEGKASNEKR